MSLLPPDHPDYDRALGDAIDAYVEPPADDAFLACERCAWAYPLDSTGAEENCGECGGVLLLAYGQDGHADPGRASYGDPDDGRSLSDIVQDECDSIDAAELAALAASCGSLDLEPQARAERYWPAKWRERDRAEQHAMRPDACACPRCGQQTILYGHDVCASCRSADRAPQGVQTALFTPAPAPVAGQQGFEL